MQIATCRMAHFHIFVPLHEHNKRDGLQLSTRKCWNHIQPTQRSVYICSTDKLALTGFQFLYWFQYVKNSSFVLHIFLAIFCRWSHWSLVYILNLILLYWFQYVKNSSFVLHVFVAVVFASRVFSLPHIYLRYVRFLAWPCAVSCATSPNALWPQVACLRG